MLCFTGKPGKNHRDFRQESGQNMHAWKLVLDGDHIDYLRDMMCYFRVVSGLPILQEGTTLGSANNPPLCNDFNLWSCKIWKWQSTEWLMQMDTMLLLTHGKQSSSWVFDYKHGYSILKGYKLQSSAYKVIIHWFLSVRIKHFWMHLWFPGYFCKLILHSASLQYCHLIPSLLYVRHGKWILQSYRAIFSVSWKSPGR